MAKVGVLALQGAFREHVDVLHALGADVTLVKRPQHLAGIDGIVLPGGESTTMDKLLDTSELRAPLAAQLADGLPTFATCAGLILLASDVTDGRPDQRPLRVLDVTVQRNGYGRQRESFEADLDIAGVESGTFRGVFIRAPKITSIGDAVEVLAAHEAVPVLGRQGRIFFSSFHPELARDLRLHELYLRQVG